MNRLTILLSPSFGNLLRQELFGGPESNYGGQAGPLLHRMEQREKALLFLTKTLNILPQSLSDYPRQAWYK